MTKYTPKTKPFKHQARATIQAARARNYGIFMEPRLGKSKAALDTVGIHALAGRVRRVLILAPSIAMEVWERELRKHYPYPYYAEDFESTWMSKPSPKQVMAPILHGKIPLVEFFIAGREETFRRTRSKGGYVRPKQDILEQWNPDLVIIDESHEYKRPGGVAAQDCWRLVRRLRARRVTSSHDQTNPQPWVILLSGTPRPQGWLDLFAPYRIMDERILGTNAGDFKEDHVIYGTGRRKWTVLGYRHEKKLVKKIHEHCVVVSEEEAGLAGKQFFQRLDFHMPAHAKKLYLEMAEEFIAELESGEIIRAKNAGVKRMRLLQIVGGFTTDGSVIHTAGLEKLSAYASVLLEQEESFVVYSRFSPEVEAVTEMLKKLGYRTHRVDGSTSKRDRSTAFESLRVRPKVPTAISFQYQAGSRAIELVGAAEVGYYSPPDGWVDFRQTSARVRGPNQTRPVRYTLLGSPGTVSVSVIRGLKRKEDGHSTMMKNPRRYLLGL